MTRRVFLKLQIFLLLLFFISTSTSVLAQQTPKPIDFSSVVIMGDSLSHSYHDGVLHADAQNKNYLSLLSKQIGFELRQGIIDEKGGFGSRFFLKNPNLPVLPLNANTFLNLTLPPVPTNAGRIDPSVRVNNFAIGGAKVTDIINARPDSSRPNDAVFSSLGIPWLSDNPPIKRSQLEFVETISPKPTLAILLIGGNDALGAAFNSNLSLLTPTDKFLTDYEEIVRRTKATGAQMILVTVPDVVTTAGFISAKDLMAFIPIPRESFTQKTGIKPEDFVTLRAFSSLIDIVFGRSNGPIPENQILRSSMAKQVSKTIKKYNKGIQKIGKREGFLVIDINKFLSLASKDKGVAVGNNLFITNKYFGGVASFDGIHLSITANAVLANIFIDEINKFYKKSFPMIDVAPIAMADPQVPKPVTGAQIESTNTEMDWLIAKPEFEAMAEALKKLIGSSSDNQ
ncbi:MAG: hypothetical protein HY819_13040 [Acidobacteria bacterium]|nr:hypothetical protein [Acidobacteriota bacterium]